MAKGSGSNKSGRRSKRRETTIKLSQIRGGHKRVRHDERKQLGININRRDVKKTSRSWCDWCNRPITPKKLQRIMIMGIPLDVCPRDARRSIAGVFGSQGIKVRHDAGKLSDISKASDIEINIGLRARKIRAAKVEASA